MSEPAPSEKPEPTPFERMQSLATRILSVPKSEVDKREEEWRENRANEKKQREARR